MDIEELIDSLRAYAADRHTRPPMEEVLTQAADAIEQFEREKEQALYDYREEIIRTLHEHKRSLDMRDRYSDYGMGFSEAFKIVCMMPIPQPPKEDEA